MKLNHIVLVLAAAVVAQGARSTYSDTMQHHQIIYLYVWFD
jgi:hypothetical protein